MSDAGSAQISSPADEFAAWYRIYPRRVARAEALKAWMQTADVRPPLEQLIAATQAAAQANGWADDARNPQRVRYIPHPATWLRGQRWEDELQALPAPVDAAEVQRRMDAQAAASRARADELMNRLMAERARKAPLAKPNTDQQPTTRSDAARSLGEVLPLLRVVNR